MFFVVFALDRPGMLETRLKARPDHRAYGERTDLPARRIIGVPLVADDGETMKGSLLVLEAPDRAAAEAYVAGDPYVRADLFAETRIEAVHGSFSDVKARVLPDG